MRFAGQALGGGFAALSGQAGTTNFGEMGRNQMEARSKEKIAGHEAEAQVNSYGLKSIADIRSAEAQAEATVAAGQAAGQASMFSGLTSGIGSLVGGIDFGGASAGLPAIGTPARGAADMKTLGNMGADGWSSIAKGLVP